MIYSPSSHPRCIWLSSFRLTQLEIYFKNILSPPKFIMVVNGCPNFEDKKLHPSIKKWINTTPVGLIKAFWSDLMGLCFIFFMDGCIFLSSKFGQPFTTIHFWVNYPFNARYTLYDFSPDFTRQKCWGNRRQMPEIWGKSVFINASMKDTIWEKCWSVADACEISSMLNIWTCLQLKSHAVWNAFWLEITSEIDMEFTQ